MIILHLIFEQVGRRFLQVLAKISFTFSLKIEKILLLADVVGGNCSKVAHPVHTGIQTVYRADIDATSSSIYILTLQCSTSC